MQQAVTPMRFAGQETRTFKLLAKKKRKSKERQKLGKGEKGQRTPKEAETEKESSTRHRVKSK